jgi:hypothetical protein
MCDACAPPGGWSRRTFLATAAATGAGILIPGRSAAGQQVEILPRTAWAGDIPPATVSDEPEVRFLLVHHTVNRNDYGPDDVVPLLRDIHRFHTSPTKGWPDIAYNFIVDRFGRAWETRTGSLDRPVAGDATGGNQGWDQKCAFLGDHQTAPPSPEALHTMVGLLAFLADRSAIDTRPGASTTFTSRGSNLHPEGTTVHTRTIDGHRSMSQTACPGDAAYAIVTDRFPDEVSARRTGVTATTAPTATTAASTVPAPPSDPPPTSATTEAPTADPTTTTPPAPATTPSPTKAPSTTGLASPSTDDEDLPWPVVGAAGGLAALVVGGALVLRSRPLR